ncbi:hypothetical protein J2T13_005344 [Paenibacillus sp. DS2015]
MRPFLGHGGIRGDITVSIICYVSPPLDKLFKKSAFYSGISCPSMHLHVLHDRKYILYARLDFFSRAFLRSFQTFFQKCIAIFGSFQILFVEGL